MTGHWNFLWQFKIIHDEHPFISDAWGEKYKVHKPKLDLAVIDIISQQVRGTILRALEYRNCPRDWRPEPINIEPESLFGEKSENK